MLDPVTAAATFATLIQLLAIYKQERGDKASADHQQFMEWLAYHRHEELKQFIASSAAARAEVDRVLQQDHATMIEKLNSINECVISMAANISELRGLATAIAPGAEFSEQAISILRQMVNCHTTIMLLHGDNVGPYIGQIKEGPPIEYEDSTFLEDDLNTLEAANFVASKHHQAGKLYSITRQAAQFIKTRDATR